MIQVSVENVDIAPGHAVEWTVVSPSSAGSADGTHQGGSTTYNQAKHFAVARSAREADDTVCAYVAGTFDLPGPVDQDALEAALLHLVRRHEVLRCTFRQLAGDVSCDAIAPKDVELKREDRGFIGSSAGVREYLHQAFQRIDPLSWPLIVMGAVLREDGATVWFACDHLVTDGLTTPVVVRDIATAYEAYATGRAPDLPEVGSYLEYSRRQRDRNASLHIDDPRLEHWKKFVADGGSFFPSFPLDIGVEQGRLYPAVNETEQLLDADRTRDLEAACRDAGGKLFMGLLGAVGVALRKEGGPDVYRGIMPVSERGDGRYEHTMGWFINTMPITFSVADGQDLPAVLRNVAAAWAEVRLHLDVPFVKAWELLAPVEYRTIRTWPYAVNFFSYLDFRRSPGAEHHLTRNARKHVWLARSNGFCFWLHRCDTGLYMNTIYAGTPRAQATKASLAATLGRTVGNLAQSGTF
ncbi:condensation domain-containing protein [Streptomyces sp. NPDC006134]|uniref:condensation domain-containing protein n=1 Tax=Streptomyces sp. NPDC006134 TaxID=3154467 RepID=UPI0033C94EA7